MTSSPTMTTPAEIAEHVAALDPGRMECFVGHFVRVGLARAESYAEPNTSRAMAFSELGAEVQRSVTFYNRKESP